MDLNAHGTVAWSDIVAVKMFEAEQGVNKMPWSIDSLGIRVGKEKSVANRVDNCWKAESRLVPWPRSEELDQKRIVVMLTIGRSMDRKEIAWDCRAVQSQRSRHMKLNLKRTSVKLR